MIPGVITVLILALAAALLYIRHLKNKLRKAQNAVPVLSPAQQNALVNSCFSAIAGNMVPTAIHEFRQPLTVMRGYLDLIGLLFKDHTQVQEYLKICAESCDKLVAEMDEFKTAAKPALIRLPQKVHFSVIYESILAMFGEQLRTHNIETELSVPEKEPELTFCTDDLRLIFFNLIANARDALDSLPKEAPQQKKIRMEFQYTDEAAVCRFQDNGPGIPADQLLRCYELFYTTKPDGNGLGMPLIRCLVHQYGGILQLEKNNPSGLILTITFPLKGTEHVS